MRLLLPLMMMQQMTQQKKKAQVFFLCRGEMKCFKDPASFRSLSHRRSCYCKQPWQKELLWQAAMTEGIVMANSHELVSF